MSPTVRRRLLRGLALGALVAGAYVAVTLVQVSNAAEAGKQALLSAEREMADQDLVDARYQVGRAQRAYADVDRALGRIGPFRVIAKQIPLVRVQIRAAEAFSDAGALLSDAAVDLVDASAAILEPEDEDLTIAQGLDGLREVQVALDRAVDAVDTAARRVAPLRNERLVGRLGTVMRDFFERIDRVKGRARSASTGLDAVIAFAGGDGDRRYLVLSQNPDEPRPTGGFIGTYGVLRATEDELDLERYASIESWWLPRPDVAIPAAEAPSAFQIPDPPMPQRLSNVNHAPDWPAASRLAMRFWQEGGEEPVDGVIGITPELLARVVAVLGPVSVPEYGETVTDANLIERMDYYTHLRAERGTDERGRKDFVVQLAEAVVQRLLDAPARDWEPLANALGDAFAAREGLAWSRDDVVADALAERGWDGTLPEVPGDFFYAAEFAATAKNGRALRRTFAHDVTLRADGTGRVETTMTIKNTGVLSTSGLLNIDSLAYITVYGPFSAVLADDADEPYAMEPTLAGHPGWGGDRAAPPLGEDSLFVAWEVPQLLLRRPNGDMEYRLTWLRNIGNRGDVLNLDVRPPEGWRWRDKPPPATVELTEDFRGAWALERVGD